jgi:Uma2 family endonuclease
LVIAVRHPAPGTPRYTGLRMSADDYLALPDDGFRYELIDGVVVMTPSPDFDHQDVRGEIEYQLRAYVRKSRCGWVGSEVDVRMSAKVVYRPDLLFIGRKDHPRRPKRIDFAPDLVVEVLSPSTTAFDLETKRNDYEKKGVLEYWIVDPQDGSVRFLRLERGRYVEVKAVRDRFASKAVPGFKLDLKAVRGASEDEQGDGED